MENQENFSRWSLLKKSFQEKQSDIVLLAGVVLVALIGFGLGQLTTPEQKCEPLIIENIESISTQEQLANPQILPGAASALGSSNLGVPSLLGPDSPQQGMFVASRNSNKYHWPDCSFAQKIKPENRIWFSSEAQAQAAGYTRCSKFLELAPAGYVP